MEENNIVTNLNELLETTKSELSEANRQLDELERQLSEANLETKRYKGWYNEACVEIDLLRHLIKGVSNADIAYVLDNFNFYKKI